MINDGPSVNWKFYEAVTKDGAENEMCKPQLSVLISWCNYTNIPILVAVVYMSYMRLLNQVQKPQTGASRKFYEEHLRCFMILQPGRKTTKV